MPQARNAGFAMVDVLVAMLLLAVTLTGACATLVQTMRATHAALLATRAVDLAADLSEELRQAASPDETSVLLADWRSRVATALPVAGLAPEQYVSLVPDEPLSEETSEPGVFRHVLTVRWRDTREDLRELNLPVAMMHIGG